MKHKITADQYHVFQRNIDDLHEHLARIGHEITDVRIRMKTYNSDASAYRPNYVALFWSTKQPLSSRGFTPTAQTVIKRAEIIAEQEGSVCVESKHILDAICAVGLERQVKDDN
jgi:hypothetical protein